MILSYPKFENSVRLLNITKKAVRFHKSIIIDRKTRISKSSKNSTKTNYEKKKKPSLETEKHDANWTEPLRTQRTYC